MATSPTTGAAAVQSGDGGGSPDGREPRGRGRRVWDWMGDGMRAWAVSLRGRMTGRRIRLIDVLRVLGLARRAVPRPVVGPKAYPQWWQRVLAFPVLVALVLVIGFALAALVGFMVVVAGFLLEQAIT